MITEDVARVGLADRVLGDRIAMRSALLPKLSGDDEARIKAERSVIVQVRKNLYLLDTDEIEALIATQLKELEEDNF
jgi:hypothetical protein